MYLYKSKKIMFDFTIKPLLILFEMNLTGMFKIFMCK
jgi:hypothetical protein